MGQSSAQSRGKLRIGGWRWWVLTLGGAGHAPGAPGTAGSALMTALLLCVALLMGDSGTGAAWNLVLGIVLTATCCLVIGLGPWAIAQAGGNDPQWLVIDEAAGICLTWLFLPAQGAGQQAWVAAGVFCAFRIFDIAKPWPARRLERLPAGWGILADDLAAAVWANLLCQVVFRFLIAVPGR